jgi:hypothetical protein
MLHIDILYEVARHLDIKTFAQFLTSNKEIASIKSYYKEKVYQNAIDTMNNIINAFKDKYAIYNNKDTRFKVASSTLYNIINVHNNDILNDMFDYLQVRLGNEYENIEIASVLKTVLQENKVSTEYMTIWKAFESYLFGDNQIFHVIICTRNDYECVLSVNLRNGKVYMDIMHEPDWDVSLINNSSEFNISNTKFIVDTILNICGPDALIMPSYISVDIVKEYDIPQDTLQHPLLQFYTNCDNIEKYKEVLTNIFQESDDFIKTLELEQCIMTMF